MTVIQWVELCLLASCSILLLLFWETSDLPFLACAAVAGVLSFGSGVVRAVRRRFRAAEDTLQQITAAQERHPAGKAQSGDLPNGIRAAFWEALPAKPEPGSRVRVRSVPAAFGPKAVTEQERQERQDYAELCARLGLKGTVQR